MVPPTLSELARVLGGAVRRTDGRYWLDTRIGGLRVAVIRRTDLLGKATYDLAVITSSARELDPLHPHHDEWRLDGPDYSVPRLGHGYSFAGCRGGVLVATTRSPPVLEHIVSALWELSHFARAKWRPFDARDTAWISTEQRRRRKRALARLAVVAVVAAAMTLIRRPR